MMCRENELTIMHINANGLSETSVHDLSIAAESRNVKVLAVTESHFRREENQIHHDIPGFTKFEARRSNISEDKGGGGIHLLESPIPLSVTQKCHVFRAEGPIDPKSQAVWSGAVKF